MRKELNIIRGHLALKLRGHFTFGITASIANVLGKNQKWTGKYLMDIPFSTMKSAERRIMGKQLHKRFTDDQIKILLDLYLHKA